MQCPQCQHENREQAKFCAGCGARLAARCAACGTELGPGARYGGECGAALAAPTVAAAAPTTQQPAARFPSPESCTPAHLAERILTSRGALECERKQVTVLFADLKGSLELQEAWATSLLGEIAARVNSSDTGQAVAHYGQALALARDLGMRPLAAHCHLGLGTLYGKVGRADEARMELTEAAELYRAMGMTFWLVKAEAALASLV